MTPDRLVRVREGRLGAGVCAGMARQTGIDRLVFQVGFGVMVFATWLGLGLYIAAFLLMGSADGRPSLVERSLGRRFDATAVWGILGILLTSGILLGIAGQGLFTGLNGDTLITLTLLGLVLLAVQGRGVDFREAVKTLPERLRGTPIQDEPRVVAGTAPAPQQEWIDLATLSVITPVDAPRGGIDLSAGAYEPVKPFVPKPLPKAKPSSMATPIILILCCIVVSAMFPLAQSHPGVHAQQIVLASGLAMVGLGLVAGTWWGRPRGLVTVSALLSVVLLTSTAVSEVPPGSRFGDVLWRPVDPNATQTYRLIVGDGKLDLTALPLKDGQHVRVEAEFTLGGMTVTLPPTAQVELHGSVGLGDVTVDGHIISGPKAKIEQVLPGIGPNPPTIELHIKGRLGDLEVTRAKA